MIREKIQKIPIGVKAAVVYTMASVFAKGLSIITVPIFTRIMSTSEIGIVNLYNSWHSLLNVIATLALTSGGYTAALKEFEKERDEYQSSMLSLTSLTTLILSIIYFVCPAFWNKLTGLSTPLMTLMLAGFLLASAQDFWMARQRYEYKYKLVGIMSVTVTLFASIFSVLVVLKLNSIGSANVAEGRLYATNIVSLLVSLVIWIYTFVKGKCFINKKYWKFSLAISIPLIGYALSTQVLSVSDRMMISKMVNNSAVGIYSTLYTVSSLSLLVWGAINSSFVPYLFQNIGKKGNAVKEISFALMAVYAFVAVIITFLAPEIVRILATEEYYEAIYIMPPIAAGVFLTSVSNMYTNVLVYYKKSKYIMYASVIAALSNIILNLIFINFFGYMAAAYTTLFSYILLAYLQAFWSKRVYKKESDSEVSIYADKKIFYLSAVTIVVSLSGVIWYHATVARYGLIIFGCGIGGVIGYKMYSRYRNRLK